MKQIVKIELYSYCVACLDGIIRRDKNVIYCSCRTLELNGETLRCRHHMDTQRAIFLSEYGSTLDQPDFKEAMKRALEAFKNRLKNVVYENEDIEFEVIDSQRYSAPFLNN